MLKLTKSERLKLSLLAIFHLVGLLGLLSPYRELFVKLSSLNLLVSAVLIIPKLNKGIIIRGLLAISVFGFLVELVGVSTGVVFGTYHYGNGLNPLILGVPLVIGINWWMLCYGGIELARSLHSNKLIQIILAASIVTTVDIMIEQVAAKLDYWHWENEIIPIQNYAAWFVLALFITGFLQHQNKNTSNNPLPQYLVIMQIMFFCVLIFLL